MTMTDATQALLPVTPELLPCPFCGSKRVGFDVMSRDSDGDITDVSPECADCGATIIGGDDLLHEAAAQRWNTRHRQAHSLPSDVPTSLGFGTGNCASLNLQGALDDLQGRYQVADGGVIARTIKRVIGQIEAVRAALPSHKGAGE